MEQLLSNNLKVGKIIKKQHTQTKMENSTLRTTLKVFSIISVVLGALAILGALESTDANAGYAFLGGIFFLVEGWLALVYIGKPR
jgi:hypothetical protein